MKDVSVVTAKHLCFRVLTGTTEALDFVFCEDIEHQTITAHRSAARIGIEEAKRRSDEEFAEVVRMFGGPREKYLAWESSD